MPSKMARVQFRVKPDVSRQLGQWADDLGMSKSSFCALAVQVGAKVIMRQVAPEQFVTPELLEAMQKAGFVFPEGDSA